MRAFGVSPSAAAFSSVMSSTAAAPSEICDEEPAVCTPSSRADGLEAGQRLERGLAQALVAGHVVRGAGGLALLVEVGGVELDSWVPKRPSSQARAARCWLANPKASVSSRVMPPLVGDALGSLELRRHLVAAEVGLGDRHAEAELLGRVDADRDPAHHLDAAGDRGIDDAGAHERGRQAGGLLAGPALGVDRGGRRGLGEPGAEPRGATDVERLLADLADAPGDDLADLGRIDTRAGHDLTLHLGQQVGGVHGGEPTTTAADGRAHGFHDHDVRHARQRTVRRRLPRSVGATRWPAAGVHNVAGRRRIALRCCLVSAFVPLFQPPDSPAVSGSLWFHVRGSEVHVAESPLADVAGQQFVGMLGTVACWAADMPADGAEPEPDGYQDLRRSTAVCPSCSGRSPAGPCSWWSGPAPIATAVGAARRPSRLRANGRCGARAAACSASPDWRRR